MNKSGRVYLDNTPKAAFELFQSGHNENQVNFGNSIRSIHSESKLSQAYFSRQNVDNLQKQLINNVYELSNGNYKIGRQSELQLQIVMRSIYLQKAQNLECNISQQIHELNQMVLSYCVSNIMSEIKQFLGYKNTINTIHTPLEQPKNISSKGQKILINNVGFGN